MSIKPIQISTPTKDSDPNMPLPLSPGPYTPSQKNRLRRHNSQALGEKPVINCWYSAEQIEEARRDLIIPKDSLGLLGGEFMDYRKPLPSITGAGRRRFVNSPPKPAPKQEKSTVQETVQTQPMTFDQNVQTPHHVHSSQQQNFSPPQQTQPPPPLPSYPPYQPPYPQIPPPQLPNPYLQMPSYYPPQSYPQPPPYQVQMQIPPSYPTVQPIMTPMAFPQTVAVQQVPVTPFNPYQVQNPEPKQTPMDSYTQTPMGGNTIFPSPDIRKKQSQRPEFFDESTPEKKKEKKRRKRSRSSSRSTHRHKSHKHRKHHRSHRRRSKHRSRSPSISHGEKRNESSMGNTFVSQRSSIQSEIPSGLVKLDAETDLNMSLSTDHPVLNSPKSQHRTVQTSPHHQFNSTHRSINSQTQLPFSHTTSSSQRFSPNKRASSQSPLRSPPPSDPPPKSIRLIPAEWTETDDNKNSTYNTIEAFEDEIDKKEQSSVVSRHDSPALRSRSSSLGRYVLKNTENSDSESTQREKRRKRKEKEKKKKDKKRRKKHRSRSTHRSTESESEERPVSASPKRGREATRRNPSSSPQPKTDWKNEDQHTTPPDPKEEEKSRLREWGRRKSAERLRRSPSPQRASPTPTRQASSPQRQPSPTQQRRQTPQRPFSSTSPPREESGRRGRNETPRYTQYQSEPTPFTPQDPLLTGPSITPHTTIPPTHLTSHPSHLLHSPYRNPSPQRQYDDRAGERSRYGDTDATMRSPQFIHEQSPRPQHTQHQTSRASSPFTTNKVTRSYADTPSLSQQPHQQTRVRTYSRHSVYH